jgi:hypothetical protein
MSLKSEADCADCNLNMDALMDQGLNKYNTLITSGDYATSGPKDAQILALQTQIQNLEDTIPNKRPKNDKNCSNGHGRPDKSKKRKKHESWQLLPPKIGEPTSNGVNGHTFHWYRAASHMAMTLCHFGEFMNPPSTKTLSSIKRQAAHPTIAVGWL